MSNAISVENVSKVYRLGAISSSTLGEDFSRWWARVRGRPDPFRKIGHEHHERLEGKEFWALDDVSFSVTEGEVLGVIGRNGAGKSTLLKILSQVTAPSSGRIRLLGRVASLLEVGTGFHPELSGRENVFLNGAILGMTKAEIRRNFDEILAFSECEAFIDTPVKRYSSGMYVRLAFAVAAHLESEILIVDEVLAVGDAQFQKKCLGKMGEVSRGGRTVLFVSHNMVAVQSLCSRAVLLQNGTLAAEGDAGTVVAAYLSDVHRTTTESEWRTPDEAPGNELLRVKQVNIVPTVRRHDGFIGMDSPIRIETDFWILKSGTQLHITYHLVNDKGITVMTTGCSAERRPHGVYRASFTIPGQLLNSGGYSLRFLIVQNENQVVYDRDELTRFVVVDTKEREQACLAREPGVVQLGLRWTCSRIDEPLTQPDHVGAAPFDSLRQ